MPDVFVSYNREDLAIAQRIVDGLVAEGLNVWLDMELKAGENYDEITEERLRGAKAVVVLWSSRSVKSRWVRAEATIGARKSTLVPAMIEECDRPVMFELIQTTDLSRWKGDLADPAWRNFVEVIRKRITAAPPGPLFDNGGIKKAVAKNGKRKAPPKQVAFRKELVEKKKSGFGAVGILMSLIVVAALAGGGVYLWRPQIFTSAFNSVSDTASSAASGVATLRSAEAEPAPVAPVPTLATTAPGAVLNAAPSVESLAASAPVETHLGVEAAPKELAGTFRECALCPLMLNIAGGTFQMGSPPDELARNASEGPQRKVAMAPFAIGVSEVTFEQWDACIADGGCGKYTPDDKGLGRGPLPVILVSWVDANAYAAWLSKKTGRAYRLPSEAEWEYVGRGSSTTPFWWGALFDAAKASVGPATQAADKLAPNPLGLIGVTGNAREWVQDCYVNTFAKAPLDGRSVEVPKCASRVIRGGAFNQSPGELRIAARDRSDPIRRDRLTGFRVAAAP